MSSMIAFAPSNRRSRWRSRNAGWPESTRNPSHTPSPRTKPASNTDTTARSRGTSSPLTQIRMRSLRGSSSKSCVPCAMAQKLYGRRATRGLAGSPDPGERGSRSSFSIAAMSDLDLAVMVFRHIDGADAAYADAYEANHDATWLREAAVVEHHRYDRIEVRGTVAGHFVAADDQGDV